MFAHCLQRIALLFLDQTYILPKHAFFNTVYGRSSSDSSMAPQGNDAIMLLFPEPLLVHVLVHHRETLGTGLKVARSFLDTSDSNCFGDSNILFVQTPYKSMIQF